MTHNLLQRGHFEAMNCQVADLEKILKRSDPWQALILHYTRLRDIVRCVARDQNVSMDTIQRRLLQLYQYHVEEWGTTHQTLRLV